MPTDHGRLTTDKLRDLFPFFRTVDDVAETVDWAEFFGNDNPVELDIGCGRGLFLFNTSVAHPATNYLGLEVDFTEGRRTARRLLKRDLPNSRVIGGDARDFLRMRVAPHSVDAAHVYFPDPWWKKKHRRRRLFNEEFADLLAIVVKPKGFVHSWTDVGEYFDVIAGLMNHHPQFVALEPPDWHEPEHDMDYLTSFHRRRLLDGATIYRGLWQRKPLTDL